jgi:hypothetical protein
MSAACNIIKKGKAMKDALTISILIVTLLNLGLVIAALVRLNGLRKDLRTPVVKKFNQDFKRKPVDISKTPENFGRNQRDDKPQNRTGNLQSSSQNRSRGNSQQNRPVQIRRPAAKVPDVFSNEALAPQAAAPVPPRPVAVESAPAVEGRRPLPPRFNGAAAAPVDLAPIAPAPVIPAANENDGDSGMEFDRSKMAHGRRNMVAKPVIEDDAEGNT